VRVLKHRFQTCCAENRSGARLTAERDSFEGIQVLRFVAALMVVGMHSTHYAVERLHINATIFSNGGAGVDIFFVISGFVMMISSQSQLARPDGWKEFMLRRLIRIVPLYWLLLSAKVVTLIWLPGALRDATIDPLAIVSSYLFLPSYNNEGEIAPILYVGWTLNFEMFFYALLAIAMAFQFNAYKFIAGVFSLCCLLAVIRNPGWPALSFYGDTMVLEFGLGMLIARAHIERMRLPAVVSVSRSDIRSDNRSVSWSVSRSVSLPIGLIGLGCLGLLPVWESVPGLSRPIVWGVPAALIVLGVALINPTIKGRVPRVWLFLGSASYALYLIHPLVAPLAPSLLMRLGLPYVGVSVALSIVVSVLAAACVYQWVERPTSDYLRSRCQTTKLV
jgi:exopolysaccharide production protein ExoZ